MSNIMSADDEFIESFAAELKSKIGRVSKLVGHRPAIGTYHEDILKSVIKNFLTDRWSVRTGFIYKAPGETSKQLDIIIVDESSPAAYLFKSDDFVIVIPEAVVCVIEVKTNIKSSKDFASCAQNIESVKRLAEFPSRIRGIIYAHSSGDVSNPATVHTWFGHKVASLIESKYLPECYIFSERNVVLFQSNDQGNLQSGGEQYRSLKTADGENTDSWTLSLLLSLIVSGCEGHNFAQTMRFEPPSTLTKLLAKGDVIQSEESFKFYDPKK